MAGGRGVSPNVLQPKGYETTLGLALSRARESSAAPEAHAGTAAESTKQDD